MHSELSNPRILFITVGQSPRPDLLSELTEGLGIPATVVEAGLLDGLNHAEIAELRASPEDKAIIARLADDSWVQLSLRKITQRALTILESVSKTDFDLVVLMSTGIFREFESDCPTVNVQRAVDAAVVSLAAKGDTIGIIFPLERQIDELETPALALFETRYGHAPHGDAVAMQKAAGALRDCAYIILSSIGYCEAERHLVAQLTGKPVILPRRIVSISIGLILSSITKAPKNSLAPDMLARLQKLTKRERQVMSLVCECLSTKAIARQLDVSPKTIEIHRSNLLRKMDVPSTAELIRLMVRAGVA